MSQPSPNILLIMADQLAPQFTGTYGHPVVKTPHMDALAARGARFDAAYCNSPLCAPSRFSFMSGQLITRIAAYDNASDFPASIPTFAHYLRTMGYKTCLSGKMHFVGPDQLHGFEERVTTDVYPADYGWTPDWEHADDRFDKWYHNMDSVREAGVAATTFQLDYDDEVAFFAKRKIFEYACNESQPFCLVASFTHPHDPYVAPPAWWNLYDPADIDLPKITLSRDVQDPLSQRIMDGIKANIDIASEEEIRNSRHAYYANTSYFDTKVGELVQALEQAELLDNTIVIVTADHGEMLGERSLWYKMNFFEHSVRVPLIIAGPTIQQRTITNACSLVDLLPTMVDIAAMDGTEKPAYGQPIDGHSLLPFATGSDDTFDEAIGEYCAEMTSYPVYMIRRGRYKYIHCETDAPLLFDLIQDPDELFNIATHSDYTNAATEFATEIADRWNSETIRQDVIKSQKQRRAVHLAMETGTLTSWDYNPTRDASQEYVRNHIAWTVAAGKTRFPPFKR
ncbi:MAG: choline-sulfatase [Chloroflexota bacterium]